MSALSGSVRDRSPGAPPWEGAPGEGCDPRYDLEHYHTFCACVDPAITASVAAAILEAEEGPGWSENLWAPVTDLYTGAAPTASRVRGMLEGSSTAPVAGYDWAAWDAAGTGYAPQASASPRQALVERSLQLICGLDAGVPATWEGWTGIHEHVVRPVRDGEMRYRLYGPSTDTTWEIAVAVATIVLLLAFTVGEVLAALLVLWAEDLLTDAVEFLLSLGTPPGEASVEVVSLLEALEAAVIQGFVPPVNCHGCEPARFEGASGLSAPPDAPADDAGCPQGTLVRVIDLAFGVGLTFSCSEKMHGTSSNHGVLTRRVWVCAQSLDRAAVAFDWQLALAQRHAAQAYRDEQAGEHEAACRNRRASVVSLRRATSVAASFGARVLLHETAHNLTLYHCWDPTPGLDRAVGGLQDGIAWVWYTYAAARVGFGLTKAYSGEYSAEWEINWQPPTRSWNSSTLVGGWEPLYAGSGDFAAGDGRLRSDEFDVKDAPFGESAGAVAASVAITAVAVTAGVVAGRPDLGLVLGLVGGWVGSNFAHSLYESSVDRDDTPEQNGSLVFAIDYPLRPGGRVLQCCRTINSSDCTALQGEDAPCWETDAPGDVEGCCESGAAGLGPGGGGAPDFPSWRSVPEDDPWSRPGVLGELELLP